ncbi:lipopolysaccharide transport system permease protein [Verrucomicrobium sp. GAS474]|uniref:ABC transporter permease n=1 Tax=Verrucomicrobium sp. GAS474 TaxID=1882831 RepID=UPI00087B18BF|nr:ABC transporter permease [Verrucomicrobium sp. GAS474]SDT94586.1 lipopolysaccharide transport system permease protein [Verrucomicrobium sp. GAS474]
MYLNIVLYKTYANLKSEIDKTYLGCIWWVLEPVINTAVFYFIFVYILKNRTENFVVFLYIGMAVYGWFSGGIQAGANSILAHSGLMQQIWLPKALFPFISITNVSWKFLFSLLVLLPLLWWHHAPISWAYLALPFLFLIQYTIIVFVSMPLAGLIPYFQDGKTVLSTVLGVLMWLSGVFYGRERIPDSIEPWFYLNPIAAMIEAFRTILVDGHWPRWDILGKAMILPLIACVLGVAFLKHVDRKITKLPM